MKRKILLVLLLAAASIAVSAQGRFTPADTNIYSQDTLSLSSLLSSGVLTLSGTTYYSDSSTGIAVKAKYDTTYGIAVYLSYGLNYKHYTYRRNINGELCEEEKIECYSVKGYHLKTDYVCHVRRRWSLDYGQYFARDLSEIDHNDIVLFRVVPEAEDKYHGLTVMLR